MVNLSFSHFIYSSSDKVQTSNISYETIIDQQVLQQNFKLIQNLQSITMNYTLDSCSYINFKTGKTSYSYKKFINDHYTNFSTLDQLKKTFIDIEQVKPSGVLTRMFNKLKKNRAELSKITGAAAEPEILEKVLHKFNEGYIQCEYKYNPHDFELITPSKIRIVELKTAGPSFENRKVAKIARHKFVQFDKYLQKSKCKDTKVVLLFKYDGRVLGINYEDIDFTTNSEWKDNSENDFRRFRRRRPIDQRILAAIDYTALKDPIYLDL